MKYKRCDNIHVIFDLSYYNIKWYQTTINKKSRLNDEIFV